jgi:single-stranded DNA-binding protein
MNHLNSILLEGVVKRHNEKPVNGEFLFTVESSQFIRTEKGYDKKVTTVLVNTEGKLAETCAEYLDKGRIVRIVGQLAMQSSGAISDGAVIIKAQHVEFRPNQKIA